MEQTVKTRQGNVFGLNILTFTGDIWGFLERTNPEVVVVTATHVGDKVNSTYALTEKFPNATIIYRAWRLDGIQMDSFGDWWKHCGKNMGNAVTKFFDAYQGAIDVLGSKVWYYTANETGGAPGGDPSYAQWIEWHVQLEAEARRRGLKLCHLNHGTGTPGEEDYVKIIPLLLACQNGDSIIGLHEYWQGRFADDVPWTVGRHEALVDLMRILNAYVPIAFTEFGFDRWNDAILTEGGWVGTGYGETACANEVVAALKAEYVDKDYVLGTAYFCWGGWDRWKDYYDISNARSFRQIIENADFTPGEKEPMITPTSPMKFETLVNLNERIYYDTNNMPVGVILAGTVLTTDGFIDNAGCRWRRLVGSGHFAAERVLDPDRRYMTAIIVADVVEVVLTREIAMELCASLEIALSEEFDEG